jgi:inhibitor of KinA
MMQDKDSKGAPAFRLLGDRGLLVTYGDAITPEINQRVRAMFHALAKRRPQGIIEILPSYHNLLLVYDPVQTSLPELQDDVLDLDAQLDAIEMPEPKVLEVPVHYGGIHGPDIQNVARANGLTVEEVVRLHAKPTYRIYATLELPLLGGLPEALWTPRLETPRDVVPAGSVGIANAQTGIYPITRPGGWQLIGWTPLPLFRPDRAQPFLYRAGDCIRFKPVA